MLEGQARTDPVDRPRAGRSCSWARWPSGPGPSRRRVLHFRKGLRKVFGRAWQAVTAIVLAIVLEPLFVFVRWNLLLLSQILAWAWAWAQARQR